MRLYDLAEELENLMQDEEATDEQLTAVFENFTDKAENICKFMAVLNGEIETFKAEEKRIQARRRAMENTQERMKTLLKSTMSMLMMDKLKAGTFSIAIRPSQGELIIEDMAALDQKYIRVEEIYHADKDAIKAELKAGNLVPGAYIEEGTTLTIR